MTLAELAHALVEANRNGTIRDFLDTHYAEDAVSIEAMEMVPGMGREVQGRHGIHGKHQWWSENMEMHGMTAEGPFLHGDDSFAVIFESDVTVKATGQRMAGREVAIYTVRDGKIVREEFYYGA